MPNHIVNHISLQGDPKKIRSMLETIKSDEHGIGSVDFNKIIPMSKSLDIEASSRTDRGLKAYRDFIDVYTLAGTMNMEKLRNIPVESEEIFLRQRTDIRRDEWELGKAAWRNIRDFGAPTWYDWCISNWGTKWNAYGYSEDAIDYGTSLSGLAVDEYAVTDASGTAVFEDVLISGSTSYTLEEVDTDIKYVVPEEQTAVIEWNKVTDKSFHNVLKKWSLTVTKSDSEKGLPQGDASLAGAKYGVFNGEQLMDVYETDRSGQFTTKSYVCGNDWSLREIEPSEGYLLNTESLHIGAEAKLYTAEFNLAPPLDSYETVKKGKIAVIKHCDDGETQIETPEEGAEFQVFLKSAGSYADAKETERDILICDSYGFAESKLLPYGIYTVKQTKGWDGKELMSAFDVFVSENNEVYRYLINNATFESLIEIVKKDAQTGKVIPAAGVGFKVRNTDTGEYIVQHINYPTPVDIDTYYTDTTGKLMMPEPLGFGNYELIEQCTAYGYVLDFTPVPFKVDGTQTTVVVEKHNIAQKGTITVGKTGEVFSSVTETDGIYQPVYAVGNVPDTHYVITAVGDM